MKYQISHPAGLINGFSCGLLPSCKLIKVGLKWWIQPTTFTCSHIKCGHPNNLSLGKRIIESSSFRPKPRSNRRLDGQPRQASTRLLLFSTAHLNNEVKAIKSLMIQELVVCWVRDFFFFFFLFTQLMRARFHKRIDQETCSIGILLGGYWVLIYQNQLVCLEMSSSTSLYIYI